MYNIYTAFTKNVFLLWIFLLLTAASWSQKNQFSILSDNDSYKPKFSDGYYTNGLKLNYQWVEKKNSAAIYNSIEIGQLMYTAGDGEIATFETIDRPITAYLYGHFARTKYNRRQDYLKWNAELGVMGKPALGKELQKFIHTTFNMYKNDQWQYQLNAEWGVGGSIDWSPNIARPGSQAKITLKPTTGATIGNIFTNARAGAALLLGKFNSNNASVFWGNHRSSGKSGREFFFYAHPSLVFQGYNATVQGGLFNKDPEKYVGKLNPLLFQAKTGVLYAQKQFFLGAAAVYESKQSLTQKDNQWYGSLRLGYMW